MTETHAGNGGTKVVDQLLDISTEDSFVVGSQAAARDNIQTINSGKSVSRKKLTSETTVKTTTNRSANSSAKGQSTDALTGLNELKDLQRQSLSSMNQMISTMTSAAETFTQARTSRKRKRDEMSESESSDQEDLNDPGMPGNSPGDISSQVNDLLQSTESSKNCSKANEDALMNRVPAQVFDRLKSLGLLKNRRTSRARQSVRRRCLNSAKKIKSWSPPSARHYTRCIWPNERGHVPENCIQVLPVTQSKTSIPSLLLSNVCHIGNKVDELQGVAEMNNASIAVVTESWLTSETPSSSISIGEYNIYRKDRNNRQGGGVVVYVKNYLRSKRLSDLENEDKDVLIGLNCFPQDCQTL